jgi:hypothetical protein
MVINDTVFEESKKTITMVIAFLRWNPFHHILRGKLEDDPTIGGVTKIMFSFHCHKIDNI